MNRSYFKALRLARAAEANGHYGRDEEDGKNLDSGARHTNQIDRSAAEISKQNACINAAYVARDIISPSEIDLFEPRAARHTSAFEPALNFSIRDCEKCTNIPADVAEARRRRFVNAYLQQALGQRQSLPQAFVVPDCLGGGAHAQKLFRRFICSAQTATGARGRGLGRSTSHH